MRLKTAALVLALVLVPAGLPGQTSKPPVTIKVDTAHPGAAISPEMFGIFFEDINFGADGGLYPERVKNRSFEFADPLMGWKQVNRGETKGALYVLDQVNNAHYLRIKVDTEGKGFGVANEGFRGMGVEKDAEYTLSVKARRING